MVPSPKKKPIAKWDLTGVHTDSAATCDIVLVHGLNGDPEKTWTWTPKAESGRRGSSNSKAEPVFWPADLLPKALGHRHANIIVYGYNADVYSKAAEKTASDNFLFQHAQTLVQYLTMYRKTEGTTHLPIVWVAHSLGGLLVKRALLYSNDLRDQKLENQRSLYVSTFGIIFLGTPHTGSGIATWGRVLQGMADAIVPRKLFESEPILIKTLKKDNERLQEINNHFLDIFQRFRISMAHENHKTDLKATKALIVDADSASPQLPGVSYFAVEATHSGMCKFENETSPGYRMTVGTIIEWVDEAKHVIEVRWNVEMEDRQARVQHEIAEKQRQMMAQTEAAVRGQPAPPLGMSSVTSPLAHAGGNPHPGAGQPHLIEGASSTGQQRPMFEYTAEEVEEDQEGVAPARHFAPINKENQTKIAQPQPQPQGQSKSEPLPDVAPTSPMPLVPIDARPNLIRSSPIAVPPTSATGDEPVFLHPEPFRPNSFFIGREDEIRELHKKLFNKKRRSEGTSAVLIHALPGGGKTHLARQYVFKHRGDFPGGIYWVRAKTEYEMEQFFGRIAARTDELRDSLTGDFVASVREWFRTFEGWLIVFDGMHFGREGVRRFIPDKVNTSMIYTSTDAAVAGEFEFNNPQILELALLPALDAQELLLLEMGKEKETWTQDDRSRALDLVQEMGRLPLMIHVAAQHMRATKEPLSKYLQTYKSRPKVGELPAYRAVYEQLGRLAAYGALNLMSILVFFDQHIPVGMITLGIKALDKTTQVLTGGAVHHQKSLNNTLKLLIAFALLERTEGENLSPTSSRSSRSFDRSADNLDTLRIHSVVQHWFIETLSHEHDQHIFWLEKAAKVFCRAYDEASRMIKEDKAKVGLPDDYKRFGVHARKLLEHLNRFEKKDRRELLPAAKEEVEKRLVDIQEAMDKLAELRRAARASGVYINSALPISIFERACSVSESDSSTPSTTRSLTASSNFTPVASDNEAQVDSPMDMMNPNHFHDPYYPPYPQDDDQETEVATPRMPPHPAGNPQGLVRSPHQQRQSSQGEWQLVQPRHRAVRRNESRRYHDRAGSWRDQSVGDPRISVSRETARGSIFKPSRPAETATTSTTSRSSSPPLTGQSGAEVTLNKIKKKAPVTERIGSLFQEKGRTSSGTTMRPNVLINRNSWAQVAAGRSNTEAPAAFASDNSKLATSPTSWNIFQKIKENIPFTRRRSSSSSTRPTINPPGPSRPNARPIQIPEDAHEHAVSVTSSPMESQQGMANSMSNSLSAMPPNPMFSGSRTARSSPGQISGPFPPPGYPPGYPPGLPVEYNNSVTGAGHGGGNYPYRYSNQFPAAMRQWGSEVYSPGAGRVPDADLMMASSDPLGMAAGMGQPHSYHPGTGQQPYRVNVYPPTALPAEFYPRQRVDGYTSQPMSRGPSGGQDSSGTDSNVGPYPVNMRGGGGRASQGLEPQTAPLRPIPFPSYPGQGYGHGGGRRPSFVETEPSPVIRENFGIDTSYARYEASHGGGHGHGHHPATTGRRRAGSGGGLLPFRRGGRALGSNSGGRSQSQSPARSSTGGGLNMPRSGSHTPLSFIAQGSPDLGNASTNNGASGASRPAAGSSALGGEAMTRGGSGSGGFMVGNGQVIEFGDIPVNVRDAERRVVEGHARIAREESEKSILGVGLGITG